MESSISSLLRMVELGCEKLMAHGGGSLPRDGSPNLPMNVKREICEVYLQRRNPNDKSRAVMDGIAQEYGIHYATVVKITRHLRVQQPQAQANAATQ